MTKALSVVLLAGLGWAALAGTGRAAAAPCAHDGAAKGYPTFCSIPATPTDARTAQAFRSAVVETRKAGRSVLQQSGPSRFGLPADDAGRFAALARAQSAPPDALGGPGPVDIRTFEAEARRRANVPDAPHP
jgi:hypothetical protein